MPPLYYHSFKDTTTHIEELFKTWNKKDNTKAIKIEDALMISCDYIQQDKNKLEEIIKYLENRYVSPDPRSFVQEQREFFHVLFTRVLNDCVNILFETIMSHEKTIALMKTHITKMESRRVQKPSGKRRGM